MKKANAKKYSYSTVKIPANLKEESEKAMTEIGCRTMTMFATLAIKSYIAQLKQNK